MNSYKMFLNQTAQLPLLPYNVNMGVSDFNYKRLVKEASNRSTSHERVLEIRQQLKLIRIVRKAI